MEIKDTINQISINLNLICRTCLKETNNRSSIFDFSSENQKTFAEMLESFTKIKIYINDDNDYPKKICNECVTTIIVAYNFKNQCENSNKLLYDYFNSSTKYENEDCFTIPREEEVEFDEKPTLITHDNDDESILHGIETKIEIEDMEHDYPLIENKIPENSNINDHCNIEDTNIETNLEYNFDTHGNYLCTICQKTFRHRYHLNRHMTVHASPFTKSNFECKICGKRYTQKDNLHSHMKRMHKERKLKTKLNEKNCRLENEKTEIITQKVENVCYESQLENNISELDANICNNESKIIKIKRKYVKRLVQSTNPENFQCDICKKIFKKKYDVKKHSIVHQSERPRVECNLCLKTFVSKIGLKVHVQKFHDKTYVSKNDKNLCMYCGKYVKCLKTHVRTHTKEQPYKCEECGKTFSRGYRLTEHKRTHSGEKPFSCDICGKSFHKRDRIKDHKKIHFNEKRHKCTYCDKSFIFQKELTYHIRRHTGEKPFTCGDCNKGFVLRNELTTHCKVRGHKPAKSPIENPATN